VLIPLLFMGDVVGRLFREFAVTLAITILISAIVSLTLVPMLSARWLKNHSMTATTGLAGKIQRGFDRIVARYDRMLTWVLARQGATLLVALATFALTALLYIVIPKGLFPTQDTGQLQARVQASESVSFARMQKLQQAAADEILKDEAVENLSSFVGVDAANSTLLSTGRMFINLKSDRSGSQDEIMQRLKQRVANVAGVTLYLQPTQDLTIDAETGPTQYRVSMEGADTPTVTEWAKKLTAQLHKVEALRNVTSDAGASGYSALVDVDRDTASRLGITASAVDDALYSAFGQRIISTIFTETNQYRVILEARPDLLTDPQSLGLLHLKSSSGTSTPLSAFATIREQQSPLQITHVAQYPATTIGFDTSGGVSLGHAVDQIRKAAVDINMPAAVSLTFLGAASAYENSLSNQLWLILAAIICVYIVLGVLYESYVHPLTILSTLPSAGVGALLMLMITGSDLGVIGIIGIMLLIGIVKKNAIMMIDFAIDAERTQGSPARRDPPGRAAAFPPDHHDHLAALFAAVPLMLGTGDRLGTAPPARHRDLRRPDRQPGADAVHDAGDLPDVRSARAAAARWGEAGGGGFAVMSTALASGHPLPGEGKSNEGSVR
jgi:multidrug efflux pump